MNPSADDLESATSTPYRNIKNGTNSPNIERQRVVTLRPGQISDVAFWPLLAASIFLDILNVFLVFLPILTQDDR